MLKVNDLFTEWLTNGGIFSYLQSLDVPWKTQNIAQSLNLEYHGNIAGQKPISSLVNAMQIDGILSEASKTALAIVAFDLYGKRWIKNWDTLSFEYNPIENYDMTETYSESGSTNYGKTDTHNLNLSNKRTGTESTETDGTNTETPSLTTNITNDVYAFNSDSAVNDTQSSESVQGSTNTTQNLTDTKTYNVTDANTGTDTMTTGGADTTSGNHTLARHGNIGVTTSQQMIESERELWKWHYFHDVVFPDLNKVFTLSIY